MKLEKSLRHERVPLISSYTIARAVLSLLLDVLDATILREWKRAKILKLFICSLDTSRQRIASRSTPDCCEVLHSNFNLQEEPTSLLRRAASTPHLAKPPPNRTAHPDRL